jgi:hypothetical protein
MSTGEPAQPCPVCETPAHVTIAKFGDYRDVNCGRCGEFMVSGQATGLLAATSQESLRKHLETARCWVEPGDKPFIRNV